MAKASVLYLFNCELRIANCELFSITAIPALLALLDITGCIITIDAMGTQTEIASTIIAKGADYVLTLKANHPTLYTQVKTWFESARATEFAGIDVSYDQRLEAVTRNLDKVDKPYTTHLLLSLKR